MAPQIILSGNSPGELWGWIRPFVATIRERLPKADLSLFLFPCNYATGKEAQIAREAFKIKDVFTPQESIRAILLGSAFFSRAYDHPVLVHLGGDVMYASLLARRLKAKAFAYQWGKKIWDGGIFKYFVTQEKQKELLIRRGISSVKIQVVGDLLVDGIQIELAGMSGKGTFRKDEPLVTFLPGSREVEMTHMLPFYLRVAELAKKRLPKIRFAVAVSPFVENSEIAAAIDSQKKHVLDSSHGVIVHDGTKPSIQTFQGASIAIHRGNQYQLMLESDCLITIPGTKCGEAGLLGTPMLVVLPTNKLEEIPYPGLANLVERVPLVGRIIKRYILSKVLQRIGFLAQPNILAGEEIVPEIVGNLTPEMVVEHLLLLLSDSDKRKEIRRKLISTYEDLKPGADKMIDAILEEAS